jgi:hypothetical protein
MPQPYNTKERSFLGYGYQRSSTGNMLFLGRDKKKKAPGVSKNQVGLSTPSAPSGGNLSSQFSGDAFGSDATALQSDAMSGQIYGGTSDQRAEAASLAGDSAPPKGKSGGGKGFEAKPGLTAGLGLAGAAISELDTDDKYGGMDVASSTLKYAAMGAVAGPIGAGVGALVGATVGLVQKKKFEKEAAENKRKERSERAVKETKGLAADEAASFYQNQSGANSGYGGADVDKFINKYS